MSAANSGNAFDLRCYVRENLIAFIKKNYPGCLPKIRTLVDNEPERAVMPELNGKKIEAEKSPTPHVGIRG